MDRDTQNMNTIDATTSTTHFTTTPEIFPANVKEPLLPSTNFSSTDNLSIQHESPHDKNESKVDYYS